MMARRDDENTGYKHTRGPLMVAAGLVGGLCLGCWGALLAFQAGVASGGVGGGYVVQACVGMNTIPAWQVGVSWISPYFSSLPPVLLQNRTCASVPWLPALPQ